MNKFIMFLIFVSKPLKFLLMMPVYGAIYSLEQAGKYKSSLFLYLAAKKSYRPKQKGLIDAFFESKPAYKKQNKNVIGSLFTAKKVYRSYKKSKW